MQEFFFGLAVLAVGLAGGWWARGVVTPPGGGYTSSAPVCALGHLPLKGKALGEDNGGLETRDGQQDAARRLEWEQAAFDLLRGYSAERAYGLVDDHVEGEMWM